MKSTQIQRVFLTSPIVLALCGLVPSIANAGLPGWSPDGTFSTIDSNWCAEANDVLYTGDFNGDGRTDLLCRNGVTGRKRLDLANRDDRYPGLAHEGFWGTDWDSADWPNAAQTWCTNAGEEIFVGDFNGDGRDDLLCHVPAGNANAGRRRIDYADGNGRFFGTDFNSQNHVNADPSWCTNAGEEIFVGDFNGDGRSDLLCYVQRGYANAGRKRIDFADPNGWFYGTDFNTENYSTAAQTWCTNAGESIYVGDFNGDGKDDLLCHVGYGYANAGRRRIDFANNVGTFFGTEFNSESYSTAAQSWCAEANDTLFVGDFNGDGKDDLLCTNQQVSSYINQNTRLSVDLANSEGTFFGTNGESQEKWCNAAADRIHVGTFNGDVRADVLCHNSAYGARSARFANSNGDFQSVCTIGGFVGDASLGAIPVHFVVLSNPEQPNIPDRQMWMPTRSSIHDHPLDGSILDQWSDAQAFFRAEVDLMNAYTYDDKHTYVDTNPSVCVLGDCIEYEYVSHTFYDQLADLQAIAQDPAKLADKSDPCVEALRYADPPSVEYAGDCNTQTSALCYPNTCGVNNWNQAFACAIVECKDPRIHKPDALTIAIMDRCFWDDNVHGISGASCAANLASMSFASIIGPNDFVTAWDYARMLRSPVERDLARGIEQHELGHVLSLGHTAECPAKVINRLNENPMHHDDAGVCTGPLSPTGDGDAFESREGGYSYAITPWDGDYAHQERNQIDDMVNTARNKMHSWSCF